MFWSSFLVAWQLHSWIKPRLWSGWASLETTWQHPPPPSMVGAGLSGNYGSTPSPPVNGQGGPLWRLRVNPPPRQWSGRTGQRPHPPVHGLGEYESTPPHPWSRGITGRPRPWSRETAGQQWPPNALHVLFTPYLCKLNVRDKKTPARVNLMYCGETGTSAEPTIVGFDHSHFLCSAGRNSESASVRNELRKNLSVHRQFPYATGAEKHQYVQLIRTHATTKGGWASVHRLQTRTREDR
jgi:hypothetical protein